MHPLQLCANCLWALDKSNLTPHLPTKSRAVKSRVEASLDDKTVHRPSCSVYCSYKRVKGRSHTVEKRLNMHPHKPHATSQPFPVLYVPWRWQAIGAFVCNTGQVPWAEALQVPQHTAARPKGIRILPTNPSTCCHGTRHTACTATCPPSLPRGPHLCRCCKEQCWRCCWLRPAPAAPTRVPTRPRRPSTSPARPP